MKDTGELVRAGPPQRGGAGKAGPAAATRCVAPEAFLQGASIAWAHLLPNEQKAIRATCRNCRQLHDRLTTHLRLTLGRDPAQRQRQQHQPSRPELRTSLGAVVQRGAQLKSLTVWFRNAQDRQREAQLLAALEACSECPLEQLELEGAVPLSGAVAEAVEARCPHLSKLVLHHRNLSRPSDAVPRGEAVYEYDYGCGQLLTLCGPRLRELQLVGVHHWKALPYMALRRCTALTGLVLDAGRIHPEADPFERYIASPAMEALVFSTVAQLTTLKSVYLTTNFNPASILPEAVRPHATCVGRLSALTALTQLQLMPSSSYEHYGDNWSVMARDGDQHGAWCHVREAHRTSLLSAMRCMPQLQDFFCPTLCLQPSELASLTALTRVGLAGLLPPAIGRPSRQEDGGIAGLPGASVALPLHLRGLELGMGSPRALALLQPSPAFSLLALQLMRFGMSDVTADGRLRLEAVAAVGPAVRLLTVYRDRTSDSSLAIDCDSGHGLLRPRADAPTGHMEWIRQLRGLDKFKNVAIFNMALLAADLSCLGHTLCNLKGLELQSCSFPAVALPLLRNPMLQLRTLEVNVSLCEGVERSTLEALLLMLLCPPHTGAVPLERLTVTGCPNTIDVEHCVGSVTQQLEVGFGVAGVALSVR